MSRTSDLSYYIAEAYDYKERMLDIYKRLNIDVPESIYNEIAVSQTLSCKRNYYDLSYYYTNIYIVKIKNTMSKALYVLDGSLENCKDVYANYSKQKVNVFNFKRKCSEFQDLILELRNLSLYLNIKIMSEYSEQYFDKIMRHEATTYFCSYMPKRKAVSYGRSYKPNIDRSGLKPRIVSLALIIIFLLVIDYSCSKTESNSSINQAIYYNNEKYIDVDVTYQSNEEIKNLIDKMEEKGYILIKKREEYRYKQTNKQIYEFERLE